MFNARNTFSIVFNRNTVVDGRQHPSAQSSTENELEIVSASQDRSTPPKPSTICENLVEHQHLLPDFLSTLYAEHEISFERSHEALKWHLETYHKPAISLVCGISSFSTLFLSD